MIEIEETLSTPARCGVIVHELAHELLHKEERKEKTRQQRELEAESVSFAVLARYGIHSESRFYLASYDVTAEMLTGSLQTISQTAKRIISVIEGTGEDRVQGRKPRTFPDSHISDGFRVTDAQLGKNPRLARISSRSSSLRALLRLSCLKNSSKNADYDGVNADAFFFGPISEGGPGLSSDVQQLGRTSGRPALRVCWISTSLRSTWLKAKRTILARSPLTRASSVTASLNSRGSRRVIPALSSVHRWPSRFTFRTFFFSANRFTPSKIMPCHSLRGIAEYGALKSRSFSTLTKNLYPGLTMIVGWTFRLRRVTSTPTWPTCCPTACPTCCP